MIKLIHSFIIFSAVVILGVYAGELSLNDTMGEEYPYVVHLPDGNGSNITNPPLHVFLSGAGSVGDAGEAITKSQWNGLGTRIREYNEGNHTQDQIIAAESWVLVMPIAPNTSAEVPEWHPDPIKQIIDNVQEQYSTDPTRVYLTGYSMGARGIWKFLEQYDNVIAAAAISAGEPNVTTTQWNKLSNTPIRHYSGSDDHENSSNVEHANETQNAFDQAGQNKCELVIVDGPPNGPDGQPAHNEMAKAPFNADMFNWLLAQQLDSANTTSSSPEPTDGSSSDDDDEKDSESSAFAKNTNNLAVVITSAVLGVYLITSHKHLLYP